MVLPSSTLFSEKLDLTLEQKEKFEFVEEEMASSHRRITVIRVKNSTL